MMRTNFGLLAITLMFFGCQQDKTVKFGAVLPLTGEAALYGEPVRKGVELAFEELQAREDFPYELSLEVVDTASDPEKGKALLDQMYESGALAVVGGVTTAEALQMVAIADEHDQVLISPSASTPQLTGISKYFYRVFPSDSREGATMGMFANQKLEIKSIVILAKEDLYAKGIQEVFEAEFEQFGGEVLELIEFPSVPGDLSGLVERVITLDPDAVYLAAYASDVAAMIAGLRDLGFDKNILTTSAFAAPEIIAQVGKSADGVFLTQASFDAESEEPQVQAFASAYREKYGTDPDLYAAHGYDTMLVLAQALKQGGDIKSEFWKSIRSIRDFTGATGTIQFDERGDVQKFPRVYVVKGGKLLDYEAGVEERRKRLLEKLRELERKQQQSGG
jgi:branched-chain amino acid transport system substrate-binding protein